MDGFVVPANSSAAEEVQKLLPERTPVVKAFCATFARTLQRQLENATFLQMAAQKPLGAGFDTALKILD